MNQDNLINALWAAPRGSVITLFGTGEGQTDPPGFNGRVALNTYPKPVAPLSIKIGGVDAQIQYFGAAPQEVAGVLQVNVTVPNSIAPGVQPIVLNVGGVDSPTLTMNVLGPDGRAGEVAYNNTGTTPLTFTVYKPDAPNTPIVLGTEQPGSYTIYPAQSSVGNDWYLQVNGSALRVISQVCTFVPTSTFGPYWACGGSEANPFPR